MIKSKLSNYNQNLWAVVESENIIGLNPGSIIPESDIVNLPAIPDIGVILKDTSVLEKNRSSTLIINIHNVPRI